MGKYWMIQAYPKVRKKYVQSTSKVRILYYPNVYPVLGAYFPVQGAYFPVQKYVQNTYFQGFLDWSWNSGKSQFSSISTCSNRWYWMELLQLMDFWVVTMSTMAPTCLPLGAVLFSKPASAFDRLGIGCLGAMRGKAKMPSKTHSCSELEEGNRKLLSVKQEAEKEEDLQKQIKDWVLSGVLCYSYLFVHWKTMGFGFPPMYDNGVWFPHNVLDKIGNR